MAGLVKKLKILMTKLITNIIMPKIDQKLIHFAARMFASFAVSSNKA